MLPQGALSYQYAVKKNYRGMTQFAGIYPFIDLLYASRLIESIAHHVKARSGKQGYTDAQMIMSLVLINLLGYKSMSHVHYLEHDLGLARMIKHLESHELKYYSKSNQPKRWRHQHNRQIGSSTTVFNYLKAFHNALIMEKNVSGEAYIPPLTEPLKGLLRVLKQLIAYWQKMHPITTATIDQDATLVPANKQTAKFCYKGYKAYQPMNSYWFEQGLLIHSEFRDGNVPAAFDVLRVLKESLEQLPETVNTVYFRTDGAGYQKEVIEFCGLGNSRFGVIGYAVSAEVSLAVKQAACCVQEHDWHPLYQRDEYGNMIDKHQQWAEIVYVPNWLSHKKSNPDVRFVAIREYLKTLTKTPDHDELPFPTCEMNGQHYKLFAIATNRFELQGDELIAWHRQRCGHAEDLHKEQKIDLAGRYMPSKYFGINAAWWMIMVLSYDLEKIIQSLLPSQWSHCHLNKLRRSIIAKPAKIISHSRQWLIVLDEPFTGLAQTLIELRKRIVNWGKDPPAICA